MVPFSTRAGDGRPALTVNPRQAVTRSAPPDTTVDQDVRLARRSGGPGSVVPGGEFEGERLQDLLR